MTTKGIWVGLVLAVAFGTGCGATSLKALNWENHTTVRTCVTNPGEQLVADICDGYQLPNKVKNRITDVDYAVMQIEHIYFRDLPEWAWDSEVSIDVTVKGLLPGGKEFRQVLDIVHVKKEANLQLQNVGIFFPVRYENRIVSLQFSIRELDKQEVEKAKKILKKGKSILSKIRSNPLGGTFLGALLASEVVAEVADVVIDLFASDDHIFSLKQVDFLPAMKSGATEPQLLFTQGRYIVVGIPPVNAYDYLRSIFGKFSVDFPDKLNRAWLIENGAYKGGMLVHKGTEQDYTFTPYISFNITILPRYAEASTIVESVKEAFRCLALDDPAGIQCAKLKTATALANFKTDAQFSFRRALVENKVIPDKPGALLNMDPAKLLGKAEELVTKKHQDKIQKFMGQFFGAQLDIPGLKKSPGKTDIKAADPERADARIPNAAAIIEGSKAGIYTEYEYSYFIAVLNALKRLVDQESTDKPDLKQRVETLDTLIAVKLRNKKVYLFAAECEVMGQSVENQLLDIKRAIGFPASKDFEGGTILAKACQKGYPDDPTWCYDNLLRVQEDATWLTKNCEKIE